MAVVSSSCRLFLLVVLSCVCVFFFSNQLRCALYRARGVDSLSVREPLHGEKFCMFLFVVRIEQRVVCSPLSFLPISRL